ncbi:MAG: DUF2635 domain-containing protein [Acetobacteraceae bacterium]
MKPAHPDLLVANPEARPPMPRHLPAEGAEVPDTQYWRRRIADGDVVLAQPSKRRTGEKE